MHFLKYLLSLPVSVTLLKTGLTLSLFHACSKLRVKKRLTLGPYEKR